MAASKSNNGEGGRSKRTHLSPPDLDYEGPASHEDMNGEDIPELAPITNRRKRRKGFPTRVTKTVVKEDSESDSDSSPPFLLPNSPARIAPSGSSDGTSSRNVTPPLQSGSTPPRSVTPINNASRTSPAQTASTHVTTRSDSTDNMDAPSEGAAIPGENGVITGAVFGFSKLTSSITTTSQGTKRVKLIIYMCNFCSYKTSVKNTFWEHCMNHLFACMHCPFKAFTRQHFVRHLEKEHPGQMPDEYVNIRDISMFDDSSAPSIKTPHPLKSPALSSGKAASPDVVPLKESTGGKSKGSASKQATQSVPQPLKQPALKFRCEACAYTTTIFTDFMEHQKLHKPSSANLSPISGNLKTLLTNPTALDTYSQQQGKIQVGKTPPASKPAAEPTRKASKDSTKTTPKENPVLKFKDTAKHARCPICSFLLQSLSELEEHIQRCHQSRLTVTGSTTVEGNNNDSGGYTWGCVYCGSKSETKLDVVAHIKNTHPGEKIRVWRWPNKTNPNNNSVLNETSSPMAENKDSDRETKDAPPEEGTKKKEGKHKEKSPKGKSKRKVIGKASKINRPSQLKMMEPEPSENADENAANFFLKQIVSSTIDDVYGSSQMEGFEGKVLSGKKTLLKIPEGSSAKDVISGKCAITVRKVPTGSSNMSTSPRAMRSLITGGLVPTPNSLNSKPVSPPAQPVFPATSVRIKDTEEGSYGMPELNLVPPLLTPSYLDMPQGSLDIDLIPPDDIKTERSMSPEPMSLDHDFEEEGFEAGNKDVDVEVRKESLRPSDYIHYNVQLRMHCCRHCVYQTKSYGHIIDHISTHTGMKTWSCSYCTYRSNRRHDLLRHLEKKHAGLRLKMIRNVPYSNKFNYPLKMSQRVSAARSMVAKKKLTYPSARKSTTQVHSHKLLKKSLSGKKVGLGSPGPGASLSKSPKSPSKSDRWLPPPTVEFWECPICFRRGTMDVLENHIPYVHPDKVRKRISKKEILAPTEFCQLRSAKAQEKRTLKVHMAPAETLAACHHLPTQDQQLFRGVDRKLLHVPEIMARYQHKLDQEDRLEAELERQRELEAEEERRWLASMESEMSDDDSFSNIVIPEEEYQCQYCSHTDKSLYAMRKHLLWNHPSMLLKCTDLRATRTSSLTPRVIHMCYRCVFYSVSPYDLLSHYSRNKGHGPESEADSDSPAEEELPVLEPACLDLSRSSRRDDDSLPALEKNDDVEKKVHGNFLTRPLNKPMRQVARKRVTHSQKVAVVSSKNVMKFVEGTMLRCKYCKEFQLPDSCIMKDHLLTEHTGQVPIAIDIRSKELKRTARLFYCPLLECDFLEYGPKPFIAHLREAHPETHFESLIMQVCPKDARIKKSKETVTPKSSPKVSFIKETPESAKASPLIYAPVKDDTPKQSPRLSVEEEEAGSQTVGIEENGVLMGGKMPKNNTELLPDNRYWCIMCDAHASSISKFKGHFLEKHIDCRPQVVDARARILRKKSRIYFCWNATCDFTSFGLKEAELHEESKMCLTNYVDDFKDEEEQLSGMSSQGSKSPDVTSQPPASRSASQMYQCLYCSWMTSSHVNMLSHMAGEHACTSGGYSEINTDFDQNGEVVMNVHGDGDNKDGHQSSDQMDSDEQ